MRFRDFTKIIFKYLKPHIYKLIVTSFALIFATALESSIPEITGQIVDQIFGVERLKSQVLYYSFLLFLVFCLSSIFSLISTATSSWVSQYVVMQIRSDMFDKLLKLPKSYFDKNSSGKILSKITYDVEQISVAASTIWLDFIKSSVMLLLLISYLFYKNWLLSLSILVLLPVIYFAVKKSSTRIRNATKDVQDSIGEITKSLHENIAGNSVVKIYGVQDFKKNKFESSLGKIRNKRFKVAMSSALNANFINILLGGALAIVIYTSSVLLRMSAGEFLSFFTALAMLIKPAKALVNMNKPFQTAYSAGVSVFSFLKEKNEEDCEGDYNKELIGKISFQNVSFSFDNKSVLEDLSFEISPGETIAIVGPTGSGKSTLIDLLLKSYIPKKGKILIDDINLKKLPNSYLRSNISLVDQETIIFNDSVYFNIALKEFDHETLIKVTEASEKSQSLSFINKLENKFDSVLGDNGSLISGGQKQRIAIARAIMKDAPILILDEATSALDSKTEHLVQLALDNASKDKTTLIIAHRLSTVKNADRIIVLKDGRIEEQGTHNDLSEQNGFYSELIKHQF